MKDVILYHGSKSGIIGNIQANSRTGCDFGKGFYMGESNKQAKGLVAEKPNPVLYTLKFKLSQIPQDRILILDGENWLYAILANRGLCEDFSQLKLAEYWIHKLNQYDVIIGEIADDRMNDAIQRFSEYGLTDKGLEACLQSVGYGKQYVVKNDETCKLIEILAKRPLAKQEKATAAEYARQKRRESANIVNQMAKKYYGQGRLLSHIVEAELEKEAQNNH
ncbi:MAG: DUF3990 domain-containing protein [Oscillospiraceae bacterium]|nr:DUF3990 domain-containing protein [Oscillospiraceae bacterium]